MARGWRDLREDARRAERWHAAADEIHADICAHGVDERGVFVQHYDTDALDAVGPADAAGALPPARRRAHPRHGARDRRRADRGRTRPALPRRGDRRRSQRRGGHVPICSFWLVSALVEIGETGARPGAVREAALATRARSASTPRRSTRSPGRHLGNFPQAFTHLALINAVMHIIRGRAGGGAGVALAREPRTRPSCSRAPVSIRAARASRKTSARASRSVEGRRGTLFLRGRSARGQIAGKGLVGDIPAGDVRRAHEAELFGPQGRLPRRGEPDTSSATSAADPRGARARRSGAAVAVPRGIWLDEAISIHQARLSLHGMFRTLYYGDRQPPLYDLALWVTIRAFGDGEFAVRLPHW